MSKFWSITTTGLDPYQPGEQPKAMQYIKLNTNESPYPCSPIALSAMRDEVSENLRLYPDPNGDALKQAIADFYKVEKNNVFVANGSDEVLAHAFVGLLRQPKSLAYPDISYSFYPVYCNLFDIDAKQVPLTEKFEIDPTDYVSMDGPVILPNPNAPTGIALSLAEIRTILDSKGNYTVIIDEAYVDFGAESAVSLIAEYPNLLVVQTLSKSRSLAGIRVGFAVGNAELIEGLERVKNSFNPYPLGRIELSGATAAVKDVEYFETCRQKIIATRESATVSLEKLGFEVLPSSANFVFAKPPSASSAEYLYAELKERGVLVRYFNKPRIFEYLRISIGTDEEMDILIEQLKLILKA
jgi:histidinol-phosphate aminotransferase